jgi:hypothetical protein
MNPDCSTFTEYGKTHRLMRDVVITEKIDGTNSQVVVWDRKLATDQDRLIPGQGAPTSVPWLWSCDGVYVAAGSRNRWLTLGKTMDNFGFAAWVRDNAPALAALGPGRHFGEWWGSGIQRGYGQAPGKRHWSLFNVTRWNPERFNAFEDARIEREQEKILTANRRKGERPAGQLPRVPRLPFVAPPACCLVVPILFRGTLDTSAVRGCVRELEISGSVAAPGFMNPEGVIVYHTHAGTCFKVTLAGDGEKWMNG